jgi:hypothetical protein
MSAMAKPTRFRDKWRIRWIDAAGKRQSDVLHDYKAAAHALRCREVEVEEVRRGLRSPEAEEVDDFVLSKDHLEEKTIANHVTLLISMMRLATTFKMPWLLVVPKHNKPKTTLFSTDYTTCGSMKRSPGSTNRFLIDPSELSQRTAFAANAR